MNYNENNIDLSVKNILDDVQNIRKKIDTIESTVDSSDKVCNYYSYVVKYIMFNFLFSDFIQFEWNCRRVWKHCKHSVEK